MPARRPRRHRQFRQLQRALDRGETRQDAGRDLAGVAALLTQGPQLDHHFGMLGLDQASQLGELARDRGSSRCYPSPSTPIVDTPDRLGCAGAIGADHREVGKEIDLHSVPCHRRIGIPRPIAFPLRGLHLGEPPGRPRAFLERRFAGLAAVEVPAHDARGERLLVGRRR
jgi:hypothetical protein